MRLRRAVVQIGIALCAIWMPVPVAGASGATGRRSAAVPCPPIGAVVNTLVVRNSNGLRAIRIGSSARTLNDVQHRSSSEVVVPAAPRAELSLQMTLRHPTPAELTN
jgi:hypothetical protein